MHIRNYFLLFERNQIKLNEPMSRHTTFGIGGAADCFVMPETIEELQKVIVEVTKANVPFLFLGAAQICLFVIKESAV